jgi:hypothetical protein
MRRLVGGRMNQNDMDRYYWRTGQRWSGDHRPPTRLRITGREIAWLAIAFLVSTVGMLFLHKG